MEVLTWGQAIFLGLVQGFTEFLPVSSSGHLAFFQILFGMDPKPSHAFDVILHFATLLVIVVFSWSEIINILKGDWAAARFVIIGSIPAGVLGVGFKDSFEGASSQLGLIGCAWIFTAIAIFVAEKKKAATPSPKEKPDLLDTIVIGVAQSLAITPGVSRSGITIVAALMCGISKERAVKLSFLLGIPVIAGAVVFKLGDIQASNLPIGPVLAGCVAATLSGFLALAWLVHLVRQKTLIPFAWYCLVLGAIALGLNFAQTTTP